MKLYVSLVYTVIASVVLTDAGAYRILCLLPYPGKSHYMVFEPLLQELQARGHNLTVVSFFPQPRHRPNRRDVSLVGLAPIKVESINLKQLLSSNTIEYLDHIPLVTYLARSNLNLCKTILDSDIFQEFVRREGDYDLILVEHFNSDCMLGVIFNYGLPSVGLMSSAMLPWSYARVGAPDNPSFVPGMTLPFTDKMSFTERFVNTFTLIFYTMWYEVAIRWQEQKLLEEKYGKKLPILEEIAKNTSVVLVNTHHSWNGNQILPPSVVEVGGLHLHNRTVQTLPPKLNLWVEDASDGFIVMSFGSLVRSSTLPEEQLHAIINVFSRLPQRIVLKWENEIVNLPKNVMIVRWLPQFDILNHPNCVAFVTHGGLLSLTEAVSAGVPVLVVPLLGDQFGNAAHARRAGIGKVVRLRNLNEETFENALNNVLLPETRIRAKLVSAMWSDRPSPAMATAVYHVERAARHRGLDASGAARRLSRAQLALLDIAALFVALAIVSFCVVCYLWRKINKIVKKG